MPDLIDTKNCFGCRSCELACSYHHRKIFQPAISSIEIKRWEKTGKFGIVLHSQQEHGRMACDSCGFCLQFCPTEARDELRAIVKAKGSNRKGAE